ncbi:F-box/kelch-repeat protein At3g06240-like [Mercurialis annua]|uniref:F-box/kelch-repeat protein At3g06240-like n=1 Tax=Mercurialis annua TaxID=3986 RepID=UPI002160DBA4|nr:F-box/kelch-repeat protein At3g06240-like [Mercurialis annua]
MSDYLSEELVGEILKRLPVKSLLKCRSVCKSWYSVIANPKFISLHLAHTTEANKIYYLVMTECISDEPHFVLYNDNDSFSEFKRLDLHSFHERGNDHFLSYFKFVGSCHGLVCYSIPKFERLIVWNPSIAEFITASLSKLSDGLEEIVGFGFDRKNDDYKFVRIIFSVQDATSPPVAEIFQLGSNSWKTVTVKNVDRDVYGFESCVELNGVIHWFAKIHNGQRKGIASLDLSNEASQELMLPHALAELRYGDRCSLKVYNQLSAAIHYAEFSMKQLCYFRCSIWVMKEYGAAESWTKQFTIDFKNHGGITSVLSLQGNGRILMEVPHNLLATYDPQTERVTPLGIYGLPYLRVYSYVESLVLLKGKSNNKKVEASIEG